MSNNGKLLTALLAGAAVGAIFGILFAPEKGSETRKKIAGSAEQLADAIREKAEEGMDAVSGMKEKFYNKG